MFIQATMDNEQLLCIRHVKNQNNILLTGSAGTGKSYTISKICEEMIGADIAVTALTGCAALLLNQNARTLHSWAGIGLGRGTVEDLLIRVRKNRNALKRWRSTEILIIDEVSMLGASLFEKLDLIGRKLRRNSNALFGGIQVVLVGDFFQLPPIENDRFVFESEVFRDYVRHIVELKTVYRQKSDIPWFDTLQNIRRGIVTESDLESIKKRIVSEAIENICTLYPINKKVDFLNESQLQKLGRPIKTFTCICNAPKTVSPYDIHNFMAQFNIPENIQLAKGAHVILTYNIDIESGLVNGSQGVVEGFDMNEDPIVRFYDLPNPITVSRIDYISEEKGENKIMVRQIPLKLAWALSIHKVQGHNLNRALMDLGKNIFEYGQIYVALSRIRSLEGVFLTSFDPDKVKANPVVVEFYKNIKELASGAV